MAPNSQCQAGLKLTPERPRRLQVIADRITEANDVVGDDLAMRVHVMSTDLRLVIAAALKGLAQKKSPPTTRASR